MDKFAKQNALNLLSTVVLNCATSDYINITSQGMPDMRYVKVYAGDLTAAMQLKASETGDANQRIITGITDKSYTVNDLTENGTFYFYVVANYINGEVANSNTEEVTLSQPAHDYELGDVNHDGNVNISDVTALINGLLSGNITCEICADVKADGVINISDVTELINKLLNQ